MDSEQLEELNMWAKTPEQQNNLIQKYLDNKKKLENMEFHKQMSKCRKKYVHKIFITPHFNKVDK